MNTRSTSHVRHWSDLGPILLQQAQAQQQQAMQQQQAQAQQKMAHGGQVHNQKLEHAEMDRIQKLLQGNRE